ncbi:MAG TPA: hypothetical protein VE401_08025 [Solirubrobacterales bacterium]|jgi:hypothetical protein|nr:hypothetical protein [Solirubrobacterales bacterium]
MNQHMHPDNDRIEVTIRALGIPDVAEVKRLAQRDSSHEPRGELLGAEVRGHLLAAVSTTTGEVIADPFQPTAALVEALRLRASQANRHPRGRVRGLLSRLRRSADSRAALPT